MGKARHDRTPRGSGKKCGPAKTATMLDSSDSGNCAFLSRARNSKYHHRLDEIVIDVNGEIWLTRETFHPKDCFGSTAPEGNWRRFSEVGWTSCADPLTVPFENGVLYRALRSILIEEADWTETQLFQIACTEIDLGHEMWGASTVPAFLDRLNKDIPALVRSMARFGYLKQAELAHRSYGMYNKGIEYFSNEQYHDPVDPDNEIKVGIDKFGRFVLLEGQHRLAVAKFVGVKRLPVLVAFRHLEWDRLKRDVARCSVTESNGLSVYIDHPDLKRFNLSEQNGLRIVKAAAKHGISLPLRGVGLASCDDESSKMESLGMRCSYLSRAAYLARVERIGTGHWHNADRRWIYHGAAACMARLVSPSSPDKVLEMGTMGVSIVPESHTIDYADAWQYDGKNPTYEHDARITPWPIESGQYELLIALRVFHHLAPNQEQAFKEARRVSRSMIIVTPEYYDKVEGSKGIRYTDWVSWNDGREPTTVMELGEEFGSLYFWDQKALGH